MSIKHGMCPKQVLLEMLEHANPNGYAFSWSVVYVHVLFIAETGKRSNRWSIVTIRLCKFN